MTDMNQEMQSELLRAFFDYAGIYLGRKINFVTIRDGGKVVPKFDELTTDYSQYVHLFEYWHELVLGEPSLKY